MARAPKTILLPRGYLSWTQLTLWEKNPSEYMRIYFYGGSVPKSRYMDFGSEVADDAENGTSERESVKALNAILPTYDYVEKKVDAEIKTPHGILKLHGRLDTAAKRLTRFRERKTGTVPWTPAKVARHGQIDFYYVLIYLKTGKLPKEAHLDWAQTRVNEDDGTIELTGECTEFAAQRTMTDVLQMISRCTKVAKEISDEYSERLGV